MEIRSTNWVQSTVIQKILTSSLLLVWNSCSAANAAPRSVTYLKIMEDKILLKSYVNATTNKTANLICDAEATNISNYLMVHVSTKVRKFTHSCLQTRHTTTHNKRKHTIKCKDEQHTFISCAEWV